MGNTKIDVNEILKAAQQAADESEALLKARKAKDDDDDDDDADDVSPRGKAPLMKQDMIESKSAKKSFEAAREQPQEDEEPGNEGADTDDHVAENLPFDEDEEKDNESDEGKKRPRSQASGENKSSGRSPTGKSLSDNADLRKGMVVNDFLKSLVGEVQEAIDASSELQANVIKGLAAVVRSNVALTQELREQRKLYKSALARIEQLEAQPTGRRSAAMAKSIERFPEQRSARGGTLTKSQVAEKMYAAARKGLPVSAMDVSRFLQSGQMRDEVRELLELPAPSEIG